MKPEERHNKITELLSKFKNGEELYKNSPMFHTVIQMMIEGLSVYEAMEQVILSEQRTQRALTDYVIRDTRPIEMFITDSKMEFHKITPPTPRTVYNSKKPSNNKSGWKLFLSRIGIH